MSIELTPVLVQPPLITLSQPAEGGLASEANADATASISSQQPDGEHAARLRSQAPLTAMKTETGLAATTTPPHSASLLVTAGAGRGEPSSAAAMANLNMIPAVITTLHMAATNTTVPDNRLNQRHADLHRRSQDKDKEKNNKEETDEEETESQEQKTCSLSSNRTIESKHNPVIEGTVEPFQENENDASFTDVFNALVRGGQSEILRQLQGARRIVAVFAVEMSFEKQCEAQAVMLWRDITGRGRIVTFPAQLAWASRGRSENWITLRGYKDRAANHRWHLRVQPLYPTRSSVAMQIGVPPLLPSVWKDVCISISDAPRFWSNSACQSQFLLCRCQRGRSDERQYTEAATN